MGEKAGRSAVASKGQQNGMRGVFLVAAELSARGYIVSTTSRNAMGADLLVTDAECRHAYSIQVKTNGRSASFWLLGHKAKRVASPSHIYVFVNLGSKAGPEYFVVPSEVVVKAAQEQKVTESRWPSFHKRDALPYRDVWSHIR